MWWHGFGLQWAVGAVPNVTIGGIYDILYSFASATVMPSPLPHHYLPHYQLQHTCSGGCRLVTCRYRSCPGTRTQTWTHTLNTLTHVPHGFPIPMPNTKWPTPTSVKELRAFLGFGNFYKDFTDHYSLIVQPFHDLTKKSRKWEWTPL